MVPAAGAGPAFRLQVVEIASLTDHLLTECDKRDGFGRCCRCSEAVPKEELPRHVASKACHRECPQGPGPSRRGGPATSPPGTPWFPASPATHRATESCLTDTISAAKPEKLANRCPLCHENFAPGEEVRLAGASAGGLSSLVPV